MKSRIVSSIDVGTTKICTAISEVNEMGNVNVVGVGITPSHGLHKGMVVNINEATKIVELGACKLEDIDVAITNATVAVFCGERYGSNKNNTVPASDLTVSYCIDCHGVHNINDPTTAAARARSPELCAKCHADKDLMESYGISTDVFDTYISDFHGTTVVLFEKTAPDQETNKPV